MLNANLIQKSLERDNAIVIALLVLIIGASWMFILAGSGTGMSTFGMTSLTMALGLAERLPDALATPMVWTVRYTLVMFIMWWAMMIAMMLPSAAPMILLHAKVDRGTRASATRADESLPTVMFIVGYLLAWGFFSAIATTLQWVFERSGLLSHTMMNSTNNMFAGIILLFAGLYQLSPVKQACLRQCQGPIQFFSKHWRCGPAGALRMGLRHGFYCLGCCWGLMSILFFGGIMNLYWIIGLALLVLLEKLIPVRRRLTSVIGGLLAVWGFWFIYSGIT